MKERATVICERGRCILLVGKAGARWNLPGGKLKLDETIRQAASRELLEETHLDAVELSEWPAGSISAVDGSTAGKLAF